MLAGLYPIIFLHCSSLVSLILHWWTIALILYFLFVDFNQYSWVHILVIGRSDTCGFYIQYLLVFQCNAQFSIAILYFLFLFFLLINCVEKLAFQLPTLRALKSIDQSLSRLAGSGAISNCVESFCFLPFSCLLVSPKRRKTMGGSLWRARGVACHHCMLGVQGCVTGRCWFSQGAGGTGFAQDEELWYGVSKQ